MPATLLSRSWESSVLHPTKYASTSRTSQPLSAVRSPPQFQSQSQSTSGRLGTSVPPTLSNSGAAPIGFGPRQPQRIYHRTRSAYLGTSSVIIIPLTRTPIVALRAVREDKTVCDPRRTQSTGSSLSLHAHREVPGPILHRESDAHADADIASLFREIEIQLDTTPPAFGLMCAKYGGRVDVDRKAGVGIENRPPRGTGNGNEKSTQKPTRTRSRPVSGYFYRVEPEAAEEDLMPEVREALHVNARIREMGYRYERIDEDECERGLE